ncbi:MAG: hypothetical protein H6560_04055 [Lewinellaceae bacterium]|nr:hypothetical protein [Lewinellaceae bacterium]
MGILPGDRDCTDSGEDGWDCVRNMEEFVLENAPGNVEWLIDDGCPVPDMVEIGDHILLLALNTQWWNHPYRRPIPSDAVCDEIVEAAIHEEIEDAIKENQDRNVLLTSTISHLSPWVGTEVFFQRALICYRRYWGASMPPGMSTSAAPVT